MYITDTIAVKAFMAPEIKWTLPIPLEYPRILCYSEAKYRIIFSVLPAGFAVHLAVCLMM